MLKTISLQFQNTTVDFLFYQYENQHRHVGQASFHTHLNYELHFALSGCYRYEFTHRSIHLHQNQLLIIPPGTPHKVVCASGQGYQFTVLTLKFSTKQPDGFFQYLNLIFQQHALHSLDTEPDLISTIAELNRTIKSERVDYLQRVNLTRFAGDIFYRLCATLTDHPEEVPHLGTDQHLDVQIENLVNDHRMSLRDIAQKINYSTRQTERLIKKIYGKSLTAIREDCK